MKTEDDGRSARLKRCLAASCVVAYLDVEERITDVVNF
jgi:hypothetical protein